MRNYLQPEGKVKPIHHKTITVTYTIPRPDFSGTSYKPGGKAGETKQHHSTWMEKDGTKLSRLTKQLNDEGNGRATTTLETDGQLILGKQAAHKFADTYEEV